MCLTADREGEEVDAIAAENVGDKVDLKLPANKIFYIKELSKHKKGPLVLVIASGSPVSLEDLKEHCDAILQIWYPGEQGGNSVADILFGDVSPSGHLPITFPKNEEKLPPYEDYSMKGRTYKYMTKVPKFPFGFGLTYSKTQIKNLILSAKKIKSNQNLEVDVTVSNIGDYDIIQLYISPLNNTGYLPLQSLKAFQRINLKKGASKKLTFLITSNELNIINKKGKKVWHKGKYNLIIGDFSPGDLSVKLGAAIPQEAIIQLK